MVDIVNIEHEKSSMDMLIEYHIEKKGAERWFQGKEVEGSSSFVHHCRWTTL